MLWVLGLAFSLSGLFIWLEFGIMYPRSGGEKVYLEAVYRRPKHLSTVIFAVNAILLNFSSANCIVSLENVYMMSDMHFASGFRREVRLWCSSPPYTRAISPISIVIAVGHGAGIWAVRGTAVGGVW